MSRGERAVCLADFAPFVRASSFGVCAIFLFFFGRACVHGLRTIKEGSILVGAIQFRGLGHDDLSRVYLHP